MAGTGGLEVVVLGRDQHIQRVGSVQQVVPGSRVFARHGRLQQRGSIGRRYQAPRGTVRVIGRQRQQGSSPICCRVPRLALLRVVQCNGAQLHQEGVPRVALMGPQGRKIAHLVGCHGGQELGQAGAVEGATIGAAPANQRFVQQIPQQYSGGRNFRDLGTHRRGSPCAWNEN